MKYSDSSIEKLIDRIGFAEAIPPTTIVLNTEVKKSDSGRYFNGFHQLVTVENFFSSISNKNADLAALNAYLTQIKREVVSEVLNRVFDSNVRANYPYTDSFVSTNYAEDYSDVILANTPLFDEAIGLTMAVKALQLFLGTNRSNEDEGAIKLNYSQMKGEINGFYNERGVLIGKGLTHKADAAVVLIIEVLFPTEEKQSIWLTGRNVW